MSIEIRIASITSSGGSRIDLPAAGIVCIVGANNVGKSQALRDIAMLCSSPQPTPIAITDLELSRRVVDPAEVEPFLSSAGILQQQQPGEMKFYAPVHGGQSISSSHFLSSITQGGRFLGTATDFLVWRASAGSLVSAATGSMGAGGMGAQGNPLSRLFRDGTLEDELSQLAMQTFGIPLILDRINGNVLLRVGDVDIEVPQLNRPTLAYADAVAALPTLDSQGDGVKSFIGLALNVIAGHAQIMLIDEPEAFLHPGQARALGRWLASEAIRRDRQIFIATHDRDLLLGMLDGGAASTVHIVRVVRDTTGNKLYELPPKMISSVWADPVLRYSNVLQGLFHKRVVVCESDADCRFYSAVLDEVATNSGQRSQADDILFVPGGGKQRVATLTTALVSLGVEANAILDFDVLNVRTTIKEIVEAVGNVWSPDMDRHYIDFANVANNQKLWGQLKNQGLSGVPAGSAYLACENLLRLLHDRGVLVLSGGEMEDFNKSFGLHGSAWVSKMLEIDGHKTTPPAQELVGQLLNGQLRP